MFLFLEKFQSLCSCKIVLIKNILTWSNSFYAQRTATESFCTKTSHSIFVSLGFVKGRRHWKGGAGGVPSLGGYSTITALGKEKGVDEKATKNDTGKRACNQKIDVPHTNFSTYLFL